MMSKTIERRNDLLEARSSYLQPRTQPRDALTLGVVFRRLDARAVIRGIFMCNRRLEAQLGASRVGLGCDGKGVEAPSSLGVDRRRGREGGRISGEGALTGSGREGKGRMFFSRDGRISVVLAQLTRTMTLDNDRAGRFG